VLDDVPGVDTEGVCDNKSGVELPPCSESVAGTLVSDSWCLLDPCLGGSRTGFLALLGSSL
jgi:hypothetical protein